MPTVNWPLALKFLEANGMSRYLYKRILKAGAKGFSIRELTSEMGYSRGELQHCLFRLQRLHLLYQRKERYYVPSPLASEAKFMMKWFLPIKSMIFPRTFFPLLAAIFLIPFIYPSELFMTLGMSVVWALWFPTLYAWVRKLLMARKDC